MYQLITLQVICFIVTLLSIYDNPDENNVLVVIASLAPGIGYLVALLAILDIITRTIKSKGKCLWGHAYEDVTPRVEHPYVRAGGFDQYQCSKCPSKIVIKWSVF